LGSRRSTGVENAPPAATYLREALVPGRRTARSDEVKYLLMIYTNPAAWGALPETERTALRKAHADFQRAISESGEMISTHALADPTTSAVVRVRDGRAAVTDGPRAATEEYLAGYYLVDCDSRERAIELAALIPDARVAAMEVRPVMSPAGHEM
jgi:hypothetical protein